MNYEQIIKDWIEKTIIGLNLCPYAKLPYESNKIKINICESDDLEILYEEFIHEVDSLIRLEQFETTILACPNFEGKFTDFNNFTGALTDNLEEAGFSSDIQVVGFHPNFCFENLESDDKANYVNRSPMPLIHLLKVQSITELGLTTEAATEISLNNEKKLKALTESEFKDHFGEVE
jgi:hypothetical protein